jgi:hypothetical protein
MGMDKDKDKDKDKDNGVDMDMDIVTNISIVMVTRSMTSARNVANMSRAQCGLLMASLARPCM